MKMVQGWAFPDADEFMVRELDPRGQYQIANLRAALRHVKNFSCAIDGGAHVGTWSKVMADHFTRVIAVEPSPDTYACLVENMRSLPQVECRRVALGDAPGFVSMTLTHDQAERANTGARYAVAGDQSPVQTIDSWDLPSLGFLKLDIEGSEFVALNGARETLRRCRPIVLFENKRLWTRHFGIPKGAVAHLLGRCGYRLLTQVSCDQVWGPR